jgi:peptidoglycan hydrolase-like protein with peptidoglycan-binding domain
MAKVQAALSGTTLNSSTGSTSSPQADSGETTFNSNLSLHSTGADVQALQQFLNAHGFTIASTGPGSLGNETTYFGVATYTALVKFQKTNSITPASGYFGPLTREAINSTR